MRMHMMNAHARRSAAALLVLGLAATSACNSLLDVSNPSSVPASDLEDPLLMPTLEAAAIQTFQCGLVNFAATAGMLSGEFWSSNGFVNNHPWEWRGVAEIKSNDGSCAYGRNSTFMGFYTPLQTARYQLENTFDRTDKFSDTEVPTKAKIQTEMRAYAGYAYLLLGEGMCTMAVDGGPEMTKAQVWAIAKDRFTDAIARATALNDASLLNMARAGLARANLDLGDMAGAATAARLVPTNFVKTAEYSEQVQARENRFYDLNIRDDLISVTPPYYNLTVLLIGQTTPSADPRVPVRNVGRAGDDNVTPYWQTSKYTPATSATATAPIPIASWVEAKLILAEAVGNTTEGKAAVDSVRATKNIQPLVVNPGDDWTTLIIEERRRQLFAEGQRYVDMLRKNLPFQSGTNRKGQTYSNLTCVPLPDVETRNNPNFGG